MKIWLVLLSMLASNAALATINSVVCEDESQKVAIILIEKGDYAKKIKPKYKVTATGKANYEFVGAAAIDYSDENFDIISDNRIYELFYNMEDGNVLITGHGKPTSVRAVFVDDCREGRSL